MYRHPFQLVLRVLSCLFLRKDDSAIQVRKSYDRIGSGYDLAWTNHMRSLTLELLDGLGAKVGEKALDLTCGTGFATAELARRTGTKATGVDASEGMLEKARLNPARQTVFVRCDVLEYLKKQPASSLDLVTCCWGLGYLKPFPVLRHMKRVLKPEGRLAIIDNSLFTLPTVIRASIAVFLEKPDALERLMRVRFLLGSFQLRLYFALLGIKPVRIWSGGKSYRVPDGRTALDRLIATGAAAGFEYATGPARQEEVYRRFIEIMDEKYRRKGVIRITHRYLAGVGRQ